MRNLSRREFIRATFAASAAAALLPACSAAPAATPLEPGAPSPSNPTLAPSQPAATSAPAATTTSPAVPTSAPAAAADLAVMHGPDPAAITRAAVEALGGMRRFVSTGADVIIKPNICVDYHSFEYAATTNPVVVATLVELALAAGAKRVRVMDNPFGGSGESAYARSGIADAVKAAGGVMEVMSPVKFKKSQIPNGLDVKETAVYQEALQCDVLINVPIAKHHSLARLTLGHKNLLGLVLLPSMMHRNLGQRLADLTGLFRPALTVVDCVRILMDHGPTGGSLDDVKKLDTVLASADIVAVDSVAATLFGLKAADIDYIVKSAAMGHGTMDLKSLKIDEQSL